MVAPPRSQHLGCVETAVVSRPSKLTPRSRDRFLQAIAAGAFPEIAARHAGFSAASYYRYLKGSTPDHAEFRQAALDARASFELRLSATLTKAALNDPKWALIPWGTRTRSCSPAGVVGG